MQMGRVGEGETMGVVFGEVAELSSWKFGDVGNSSLRDAKGLASGQLDPGCCLLSWRDTWRVCFGISASTTNSLVLVARTVVTVGGEMFSYD